MRAFVGDVDRQLSLTTKRRHLDGDGVDMRRQIEISFCAPGETICLWYKKIDFYVRAYFRRCDKCRNYDALDRTPHSRKSD